MKKLSKFLFVHWKVIIISLLIGAFISYSSTPNDYWMTAGNIQAENGTVEMLPRVNMVRIINRPFYGSWDVIVRKRVDNGWSGVCPYSGSTKFELDTAMPEDADLAWWSGYHLKCTTEIEPGTYFISSCWTIERPFTIDKIICRESNVFEIKEAQ